ncbi:TetR/AcrR family transcriptional regulator [Mesorhizobium sp. DCY119]|uniref:TetR/AcrR family transcriptional regulator n=1 Tax=Mesorhizobium sp. DCY119 TaxID=2108445 RepID=UPI000E6BF24B|nr:TetR/AcrR family transcriptional regulator [Mesorhizobium sp. DCY119]RJG43677.1 TetR/AcrR family transcriptional regulator [Mesorhizobium sp. DCY119]
MEPSPAPAEDTPTMPRRAPTQQRSRERVERILEVASALIATTGSDAMRMSEVAENAGISIGSLYQYFPDKGAILRMLAERYNAQGRECIEAELADVRDMAGLRVAFDRLIDIYYGLFLAEPVIRDIWFGTQADKGLRDVELESGRLNGALLSAVLKRLRPEAEEAELDRSAFLIMSLGESTMRLAISVEREEGDALVENYKRMVLREMEAG